MCLCECVSIREGVCVCLCECVSMRDSVCVCVCVCVFGPVQKAVSRAEFSQN